VADTTPRRVRAIRGAIDVEVDSPEAIAAAVRALVSEITSRNALDPDDIVSAIFTATPDLTSVFPALPARDAGWSDVPLLCATEIGVDGSLPRCIRVLVTVERSDPRPGEHVYLGQAIRLRPDLHRT
jgi:chorismate mutase